MGKIINTAGHVAFLETRKDMNGGEPYYEVRRSLTRQEVCNVFIGCSMDRFAASESAFVEDLNEMKRLCWIELYKQ